MERTDAEIGSLRIGMEVVDESPRATSQQGSAQTCLLCGQDVVLEPVTDVHRLSRDETMAFDELHEEGDMCPSAALRPGSSEEIQGTEDRSPQGERCRSVLAAQLWPRSQRTVRWKSVSRVR
jgi:hypothetical protein